MTQKISLHKKVYDKDKFKQTVDTSFSEIETPTEVVLTTPSVDEFFEHYKNLFYDIPESGDVNSHEYLVKTSGELVGQQQANEDIQNLINEINLLRQENLEQEKRILELTAALNEQ